MNLRLLKLMLMRTETAQKFESCLFQLYSSKKDGEFVKQVAGVHTKNKLKLSLQSLAN